MALWTPSDLSTAPHAWWDFSNLGSLTLDGSKITAIADLSGNGYTLSQGDSDKQPLSGSVTQNGLDTGTFDGTDDVLVRSDALGFTGNPAVVKIKLARIDAGQSGSGDDGGIQIGDSSGAGGTIIRGAITDNSFRFNNGNRIFDGVVNGWHLWMFIHPAGGTYADSLLYVDGVLRSQTSVTNGTNTPTLTDEDTVFMGQRRTTGAISSEIAGDAAETIILNYVPSTDDRQLIEGSIFWKWGLEALLPTGHPYEDAAPTTGDDLLADDIESASEVTSPSIAQVHGLTANDVESTSEVTSPAISQVHALTADDVQSTSEVTAPALSETNALLADDIESTSEVTAPALSQVHALSADDVQSASEVTAPALAQIYALAADDVEAASEVTSPAAAEVEQPASTDRGGDRGGRDTTRKTKKRKRQEQLREIVEEAYALAEARKAEPQAPEPAPVEPRRAKPTKPLRASPARERAQPEPVEDIAANLARTARIQADMDEIRAAIAAYQRELDDETAIILLLAA